MAIPDHQSIMLPLLKFLGDMKERSIDVAIDHINDLYGLTAEERRRLLPSGQQSIIEIQKFVGALQGQRANKGIFITTSNFSNEAWDYAKGVSQKVVLIDGRKLADLLIEHDVGVSKVGSYEVKKIDLDFFTES